MDPHIMHGLMHVHEDMRVPNTTYHYTYHCLSIDISRAHRRSSLISVLLCMCQITTQLGMFQIIALWKRFRIRSDTKIYNYACKKFNFPTKLTDSEQLLYEDMNKQIMNRSNALNIKRIASSLMSPKHETSHYFFVELDTRRTNYCMH